MANVVDFSPLRQRTGYADVLDPVAEAVQHWRERRFKKSQQDAILAQKAKTEDRMLQQSQDVNADRMRRAEREDNRLTGQYTVANTKGRNELMAKARAAAARPGGLSEAESMIDSYQEMDPTTGQVRGGRDVIPFKTQAPAAPAPVVTSTRMQPGEFHDYSDYDKQPDAMAAHAGEVKAFQDDQAAEQKTNADRMAAYEKNKDLDTSVQIGAGSPTTVRELRYGPSRQEAENFDRYIDSLKAAGNNAASQRDPAGLGMANRKIQQADRLREAVATGQLPAAKALEMVEKGIAGDDKAGLDIYKTEANNAARLEQQRIANQRPRAPSFAGQNLDLKEKTLRSGNLRKDIKSWVTQYNAKTTQEAALEFPTIEKKLNSGNGKLQQEALITMMRLAQKDNRFSDADARMAMNTGAGWLDQVENFVSKGGTGTFGDDVIENASKAARALHGYYREKNAAMLGDADSFVDDPAQYDSHEAASILGREIPGFKNRRPEFFEPSAPKKKGNGLPPNLPIPGADARPKAQAAPAGGSAQETTEQRTERLRKRLMELRGGN